MTRIYLAAPLFSEAERAYNFLVGEELKSLGFDVFLPQSVEKNGEQILTKEKMSEIFRKDITEIDKSDIVVAICEGTDVDSGTAWEIGYAYAKNKPVFSLRTDARIFGGDEHVNLMLEESSTFCVKLKDLIEKLKSFS